jgi:chemotaxis protein MotA
MEHGKLLVLLQPAELVIIGGAALGTLFIANPLPTIIAIFKSILGILGGSKYNKACYLEQLKMLNDLFMHARKNGFVKLEADVDEPDKSRIFTKYPKFLKDRHAVQFVCDTLRMAITGGVAHFDVDQMMEADMDVHHHEKAEVVLALSTVGDALPGLGIVAAVLGVVITMGALGGPPEEIGHKVAAALAGTFLGILLCYGFVGPMASNITKINDAEHQYYNFPRVGVMAFIKGSAPITSVEFARRVIPAYARPGFSDMEKACKSGGGA